MINTQAKISTMEVLADASSEVKRMHCDICCNCRILLCTSPLSLTLQQTPQRLELNAYHFIQRPLLKGGKNEIKWGGKMCVWPQYCFLIPLGVM